MDRLVDLIKKIRTVNACMHLNLFKCVNGNNNVGDLCTNKEVG